MWALCLRVRGSIPYGSRPLMKRFSHRSAASVHSGPAVRGLTALVLLVWGDRSPWRAAPLRHDAVRKVALTIQRAYEVLHQPAATDEERRAVLASLAKEVEVQEGAKEDDPHRLAVARWLEVALQAQSSHGVAPVVGSEGDGPKAPPISNDSLEGASAIYQAHLAKAGGQARRASALLLSVPSSVSGHEDAWSQGLDQLVEQESSSGDRLMESQLMTALPIRVERRLEMRLVDLLERSGAKLRAVELLNARWHTKHKKTRASAARLKALGSPIASAWSFVRPLLDVRAGRAPAELKVLTKLRKKGRRPGAGRLGAQPPGASGRQVSRRRSGRHGALEGQDEGGRSATPLASGLGAGAPKGEPRSGGGDALRGARLGLAVAPVREPRSGRGGLAPVPSRAPR